MSDAPTGQPKSRVQRTELIDKLNLGRLRLERRRGEKFIYCRAYLQGKYVGKSTGEETPNAAAKVAQKWYLEQLDRIRKGEHLHGKTFEECATAFLDYADSTLKNEVSEGQRRNYRDKWNLLKKHFDRVLVADVNTAFLRTLRDTRAQEKNKRAAPVTANTLKKDMVFIRLVLRHAKEHMTAIDTLPEFPSFRGALAVVAKPTPFLTMKEFTKLFMAARAKANEPNLNPRTLKQRRELYAFVMISVGACLRVHEALSIRWMDCTPIRLGNAGKQSAVRFRVLSKLETGGRETRARLDAFGLYSAVRGYDDLKAWYPNAKPEDKLFTEHHPDGLTELLKETGLHVSTHPRTKGQTRDARSFRTTGISMHLEYSKNPDYNAIAKWARTSPAMLYSWYDQNFPERSVAKIAEFRTPKAKGKTAKTKRGKANQRANPHGLFEWELDE